MSDTLLQNLARKLSQAGQNEAAPAIPGQREEARQGELLPLVPRAKKRSAPPLRAVAEQYEKKLEELERAMRETNADEVRHVVAKLDFISGHLKEEQGNIDAYLDKGRFDKVAREQLRREYVSRYVMLRGGGPTESPQDIDSAPLVDPDDDKFLSKMTDQAVRHGFIRKVYGILFAQLLLTSILSTVVRSWLDGIDPGVLWVYSVSSSVVLLGTVCVMTCKPGLMKQFPVNYVLLLVMTLAMSVLIGFVSVQYKAESVILAIGMTAVIVVGLSLFACQTTYDFTGMGPYLLCACLAIMCLNLLVVIAAANGYANHPAVGTLRLTYLGFGVLLFSFYIVYDTQLIACGKHKRQFSIDDYCMAAISLYLDIINLFLFILEIFGDRK